MADIVEVARHGPAALVALNNPPVNAASHPLRAALVEVVERLDADPEVQVIVLYGAGRGFIAGADIREFGTPPKAPWLPDVCTVLETCTTPLVSVLHGATLGGGLEVALATHARVALPDAVLGFPEVGLGILPGAGGTQRTPRLSGIAAALDLIVSGRRIDAETALEMGLVDRVSDGAPEHAARQLAEDVLAGRITPRRTGALITSPSPEALAAARDRLRDGLLFAPPRCVEAVAASTQPLAEGLARERALFEECMASPQRAALIHAFFAERAVAKIPEADARPHPIAAVGVVGGGTMGRGIAASLLIAGLPVTLIDPEPQARGAAEDWIDKTLAGAVERGKMSAERAAQARQALHLDKSLTALAQVDLVIEAAPEDLSVKAQVFAELDRICQPQAVLATNTSYLDITAIAAVTRRPAQVLGLHFFAPAHIMRLLEVVVADQTSPETVATGFALAKTLRKVAVRAGVCDGFIGNRMLTATRAEAEALVLEGASPAEVDAALESAGFAMGPFAVSDLSGLDIAQAARRRRGTQAPLPDALCARGWYGRKSGLGYYRYADGSRHPNPELTPLLDSLRSGPPRALPPAEIVTRYLRAMAREGARIVDEGIAQRPVDVDAVQLFGYGFPRHLGGPMHWAETQKA